MLAGRPRPSHRIAPDRFWRNRHYAIGALSAGLIADAFGFSIGNPGCRSAGH
jgi:hypothetical protein